MDYKLAVDGINLAAGKSVIIGDKSASDGEVLFRDHGRVSRTWRSVYHRRGHRHQPATWIHQAGDDTCGLLGLSGDPSPVTLRGEYVGMKARPDSR